MDLILKIAIGVAAGIVFAVLLIRFWQPLLAWSMIFGAIAVLLSVIIVALYFMWGWITAHQKEIKPLLMGIGWLIMMFIIISPILVFQRIIKRFPRFDALYNRSKLVSVPIAVFLGIFGFLGISALAGFFGFL